MQNIQAAERSPLLFFEQFVSVVGIYSSETSLLAIGRLKNSNEDYLIRYFRVKPEYFDATVRHLERCQEISHENIQKIQKIITNPRLSEICVLYNPVMTLLEEISSRKFLSEARLSTLLLQIQAGLIAQQAYLGTQNNFIDEWNVFISEGRYTLGAALPMPNSYLLLPIKEQLGLLNAAIYQSPRILAPDMRDQMVLSENQTNSMYDVYSLGVLALRAIGMTETLENKLNSYKDRSNYQEIVAEIIDNFDKDLYRKTVLDLIGEMIGYAERPSIDRAISGLKPSKMKHDILGLSTFHKFVNGKFIGSIGEVKGHHGKQINCFS